MYSSKTILQDPEATAFLDRKGYEVHEEIGKGGFARVYRVFSKRYKQFFVCKVSSSKNEKKNRSKVEAYQNELSALSKIHHMNVVNLFDAYIFQDRYYLIMEYYPNGTLGNHRSSNVYDHSTIMKFLAQLISAVMVLHENLIAHLDIKPHNILLDSYNRLKLCDFGLSKSFDEYNTLSTNFCGSKPYAAPQIWLHIPFNPFKADVYSLGVTMFFIVTGRLPFNYHSDEELRHEQKLMDFRFKGAEIIFSSMIRACLQYDERDRPDIEKVHEMLKKIQKSHSNKLLPTLAMPRKIGGGDSTRSGNWGRFGFAYRRSVLI